MTTDETDVPEPPPPASVSKLPLLIMGAVVAIVVLVLVVLAAVRSPVNYEPGTPEATLQNFFNASFEGDDDAMLALLVPEFRGPCADELDERRYGGSSNDDQRVSLEEIEIDGDQADATVMIRRSDNDPFASSSSGWTRDFGLRRVEQQWLIEYAEWPSVFSVCTRDDI